MEEGKYSVLQVTAQDEIWALAVDAAQETLRKMGEKIPERIEAIQATEKLQAVCETLEAMKYHLVETFTEQKRERLLNQYGNLYDLVHVIPVLSDKAKTILFVDDLDELCRAAHNECRLCAEPDRCNRCTLGRAFDHCVPYSRGKHSSWSYIDIDHVWKEEPAEVRD